ncbi:MAG TPA: 16S rRNA (cytosine(967)-C(5))-methyltransferase RsmB [Gammaproteobacteria bacterium]
MAKQRASSIAAGNPRLLALQIIERVIVEGESLSAALPTALAAVSDQSMRAQIQALCYGVLRGYGRFDALLHMLLEHPLKPRDQDLRFLLMLGLYELEDARSPEYAVVSAVVEAAAGLNKVWAKGLMNAVLRRYLREHGELVQKLEQDASAHYSFPQWMIRRLQQDWPQHWPALLDAANRQAPMFLRVDINTLSRGDYMQHLQQQEISAEIVGTVATAVKLTKAGAVETLPGFDRAWVSVQDAAAQQATLLLDPQPGERILDACAAPGGKTLHILQQQPQLKALVAVDVQAERVERVRENLRRAHLESRVDLHIADVAVLESWWDGQHFDRILLDVPCTASGVIRRHPDIKWLRREQDVAALVAQQKRILAAVWSTLAPGGVLFYCTCSLLREENERQIAWFLNQQQNAAYIDMGLSFGIRCSYGTQILTGDNDMDGFFYAALRKAA